MYYLVFTDHLGGRIGMKIKGRDKALKRFHEVSKQGRETALYLDTQGFHSTTQLQYLILWHSSRGNCYWGNSLRAKDVSDRDKAVIKDKRYIVRI